MNIKEAKELYDQFRKANTYTKDEINKLLEKDVRNIILLEDQTEELCLKILKEKNYALALIRNKTPKLCLEAVKAFGSALYHVPYRMRTKEVCSAALKNDIGAFEYVPTLLRTAEMSLAAVKASGMLLREVVSQTPEICMAAVQNCYYAFQFVQKEFITPEMCLLVVQQSSNGNIFTRIPQEMQTVEMLALALSKHKKNMKQYEPYFTNRTKYVKSQILNEILGSANPAIFKPQNNDK